MNYWLVKSEPNTWSWDDQLRDGTTGWDGVRNAQASNHMKRMKRGDRALFYHSGKQRAVVGVVEVVREYHPDPTDDTGRFGQVSVKTVESLPEPVTLKQIKDDPALHDLALVRQPRLSVMPVTADQYQRIHQMAEKK